MTEPNGQSEAEDITVQSAQQQVQLAIAQMISLAASSEPVDGRVVLRSIADTVLPALGDAFVLIDRLEAHAEWATKELADEEESQLLPEDADRIHAFVDVVLDLARSSVTSLDPDSDMAKGFRKLIDEGTELLRFVDDVRLPDTDGDGDDDDDDDDDEGEGEGASDDAPRGEA